MFIVNSALSSEFASWNCPDFEPFLQEQSMRPGCFYTSCFYAAVAFILACKPLLQSLFPFPRLDRTEGIRRNGLMTTGWSDAGLGYIDVSLNYICSLLLNSSHSWPFWPDEFDSRGKMLWIALLMIVRKFVLKYFFDN